jgi:hypothetical protein
VGRDYEALFCPNCGIHLNDFDTQDEAVRTVDLRSSYTCGWCGVRTRDWNHVAWCRKTIAERNILAAKKHAADVEAVRVRLREAVAELEVET